MNKSPKDGGSYPFVQTHIRIPDIFLNFLKFFGSQTRHYQRWRRSGKLCADVEYSWETSLHDRDVEEFLRNKTTQWRCGGILKDQTSTMETWRSS